MNHIGRVLSFPAVKAESVLFSPMYYNIFDIFTITNRYNFLTLKIEMRLDGVRYAFDIDILDYENQNEA
jgi:hypothetical protein